MLPVAGLDCRALNRLLQAQDPLAAGAGELRFETVQGMLKGFIDLVFRVDGRYYILDYKSNHLGGEPGDYGAEPLRQAMREHRYDLQYQLYTLALHRLLRQRLPDYDYDRDVGGVFYLFLRGMRADDPVRLGVFHCKPERGLVESLDRLFCGAELSAEAG
ncbi:PD-(D/E)XK nuclease family protein [Marinobacterium aestuariivivens]|uniref:PD-(D/E)XK nuclease family protein n=1 Tax=Marinobacterium aestuariivivens TaxID=1698799 RepID=A0ABW1ZUU5_9GAMM